MSHDNKNKPETAFYAVSFLLVFALASLVGYVLIGPFVSWLTVGSGVGIGWVGKLIFALLFGALLATVTARNLSALIFRHGVPGFVEPKYRRLEHHVRFGLITRMKRKKQSGRFWKEIFSVYIPASVLEEFMNSSLPRKMVLKQPDGKIVLLQKRPASPDEKATDSLYLMMIKNNKVILHVEQVPDQRPVFRTKQNETWAECTFNLTFLGCDESMAIGSMTFRADQDVLRNIFLR